jgi:hypothetical protein
MKRKKYICEGTEFTFDCSDNSDICLPVLHVNGPFCPNCHHPLYEYRSKKLKENGTCEVHCTNKHNCKWTKKCRLKGIEELRSYAHSMYHAKARGLRRTISLDLPPTTVKCYDSDDNYFISAKITQRNGRCLGVVYIGEKKENQDAKDYSQFFLDLDQRQARFDNNNKFPGDDLLWFEAEFKDTITRTEFPKIRRSKSVI